MEETSKCTVPGQSFTGNKHIRKHTLRDKLECNNPQKASFEIYAYEQTFNAEC